MTRKNARNTPFPAGVTTFKVRHGDFVADIDAKDFPDIGEKGEFRVYRIYGDINRLDDLQSAISNLMMEHGVMNRRVILQL